MAAKDLPVDVQLGVHRTLDGELGGGLLVELFPHVPAQIVVGGQGRQVLSQSLPVAGLEEVAVDVLVNEIGNAAHRCGHRSQVETGAIRQGVGEGLGEAGEDVDIQGAVKAIHTAADPAGKAHLAADA